MCRKDARKDTVCESWEDLTNTKRKIGAGFVVAMNQRCEHCRRWMFQGALIPTKDHPPFQLLAPRR